MEEPVGQQYALQVAVQTMKERCLQLQQRLTVVEEENMQLKMKCNVECLQVNDTNSKSEVQILREKVAQLTKQKSQLTHNVLMVATENKHLWNRLSKLTQANQTLGSQLTKLNDSVTQDSSSSMTSPTHLIRSRTFTQETPHQKLIPKLDKEVYIDTSLEDISLKILNNIAQEKSELEKQCAQMTEIQQNNSFVQSSLVFAYPEDDLQDCDKEIIEHTERLKYVKDMFLIQRDKLKDNLELLKKLQDGGLICKSCKNKSYPKAVVHKQLDLEEYQNKSAVVGVKKSKKRYEDMEHDKICPMCSKNCDSFDDESFIKHVQGHFTTEDPNYLNDFDFIA